MLSAVQLSLEDVGPAGITYGHTKGFRTYLYRDASGLESRGGNLKVALSRSRSARVYSLAPMRAEYSSRYRSAGSTMSAVSTARPPDS